MEQIALNGDDSFVDYFQELYAQTPALLLVPTKCIFDIRRGRRTDNDLH